MSVHQPSPLQQVISELVVEIEAVAEAIAEEDPALATQLRVAGWQATRQVLEIVTGRRWDEASQQFIPPLQINNERKP